jgi:hypothetical protein
VNAQPQQAKDSKERKKSSTTPSSKRITRSELGDKVLNPTTNPRRNSANKNLNNRRERTARNTQEANSLRAAKAALRDRKPVTLRPKELRLVRAKSFKGDLRQLPNTKPEQKELPEREEPTSPLLMLDAPRALAAEPMSQSAPQLSAPAPTPSNTFNGLDFANWGAGRPPDTVGDIGKDYYIQAVNTSIGIYRKSDSVRVAAFTFDTFMSQGNFGNLCDTENFGDPVILYDTFEDRWVITDFAFQLDGSNNVINPPGAYQCFATSKTGDPVAGGWDFFSIHISDKLNDYPKFGIWPDGIYMSANMFGFPATGSFEGVRVWALNKAQMYAAAPTVQVVQFDLPSAADFSLLPANARLKSGTPPTGSPNYFSTVWQFLNVISVWKFHVAWNSISM